MHRLDLLLHFLRAGIRQHFDLTEESSETSYLPLPLVVID